MNKHLENIERIEADAFEAGAEMYREGYTHEEVTAHYNSVFLPICRAVNCAWLHLEMEKAP